LGNAFVLLCITIIGYVDGYEKKTLKMLLVLAVIIVSAAILVLVRFASIKKDESVLSENIAQSEDVLSVKKAKEGASLVQKMNGKHGGDTMPKDVDPEVWEKFLTIHERGLRNNVKINFYGKAIDQYNQPVSSAKVTIRVSSYEESAFIQWSKGGRASNSEAIELKTDANGLFGVHNLKGRVLYIDKIEKDGYIKAQIGKKSSFGYTKNYGEVHIPDNNMPVVYKMWKKEGAEPLIKNKLKIKMSTDNKEYYINLVKGKSSPEPMEQADLTIRMHAEQVNRRIGEWGYTITAVNGGVYETDDAFLYRAPDSGYKNVLVVSINEINPQWPSIKKIFLKSRNGRIYAALDIRLIASHDGKGIVHINSIINPNSSKNLEYDPQKRIDN
jgi:hypothetical protein